MSETKGTIIVVDDDDSIRRALTEILRNEGYEIAAATDGTSALTLTSRRTYDLMFLDIMMPGYNGLEVITLMQAARPDMPIVAVSALSDQEIINQALLLGAREYVKKPFSPKQIAEIADRFVLGANREEPAPQTDNAENSPPVDNMMS